MSRKRDDLTPQDVIRIFQRLPFWVGPVVILTVFAGMRWALPYSLASDIEATKEAPLNIVGPVLYNGVGKASRFVAPYAAGLVAILWGCAELVKWSDRRQGVGPLCPVCSSPMVVRTAKRGVNSGSRFWGCSQYPKCETTRPL